MRLSLGIKATSLKMPKAYLRYEESSVFGVITSPASNVTFDCTGKLAVVGALESCLAWKVRGGEAVHRCRAPLLTRGQGGRTVNEMAAVTRVVVSPSGDSVAVGFESGDVRTFRLKDENCSQLLCLRGHRKGISALAYAKDSELLSSGGEDCEIVVWDVTSENGLYRLRGHRGIVTDLKFLYHGDDKSKPSHLVSSSKDTFVKIWDLQAQYCVETIVGHRAEVWSFDIDPGEKRMVTLSTSTELRVWKIHLASDTQHIMNEEDRTNTDGGMTKMVSYLGKMIRKSVERGITVRYSKDGSLLGCHGAGKQLEVYRIRSITEQERRLARRKKRQREKQANKGHTVVVEEDHTADEPYNADDEFALASIVRGSAKLRSFSFSPDSTASDTSGHAKVLLALQNNSLEQYDVDLSDRTLVKQGVARAELTSIMERQGHRSDIRAIAINKADDTVASVGKKVLKIWNVNTLQCLITAEIEHGLCVIFIPGDAHVLVGTKKGTLLLFSLASGECIQLFESAHVGAIWSIDMRPDEMGFCTGGADHEVKFWNFGINSEDKQPRFKASRTLSLSDDVLCVRYTHTKDSQKLLVCAALLDSTIKVFFDDSLKFFLSLYGHRLPVLCLDVSTDNTLCITGSADKNVKIWGLDFGDCHKSMFLHSDSIMAVRFVPKTHMFFSCGKDGSLKMVDADTFQQIQVLSGHHGEIWGLSISRLGDFVVSCSSDRSLRIWKRTKEQLFLEEERDRDMARKMEEDLNRSIAMGSDQIGSKAGDNEESSAKTALEASGIVTMEAASAGQRTASTVKAGERLLEALEICMQEEIEYKTYLKLVDDRLATLTPQQREEREKKTREGSALPPLVEPPNSNILLLGRSPLQHMLHTVRSIPLSELEEALLVLPFEGVNDLIHFLTEMITERMQVELVSRVLFFVLRLHHLQIVSNQSLRQDIELLKLSVRAQLEDHKQTLGFNMAGLKYIQRVVQEKQVRIEGDDMREKLAKKGRDLGGLSTLADEPKKKKFKKKK